MRSLIQAAEILLVRIIAFFCFYFSVFWFVPLGSCTPGFLLEFLLL